MSRFGKYLGIGSLSLLSVFGGCVCNDSGSSGLEDKTRRVEGIPRSVVLDSRRFHSVYSVVLDEKGDGTFSSYFSPGCSNYELSGAVAQIRAEIGDRDDEKIVLDLDSKGKVIAVEVQGNRFETPSD